MIVAMITVRMMQVPVDQVVHVIAMGHSFMSASRTVHMALVVRAATMPRCAPVRIGW